jgi:hypothetical protein
LRVQEGVERVDRRAGEDVAYVLPFNSPKIWSLCSRNVQSSVRSSVVPLIPPVAVCSISMCVTPSSRYCFVCRVMVAKPMALRVSQLMPCRARTGSVSSERVLFFVKIQLSFLFWKTGN